MENNTLKRFRDATSTDATSKIVIDYVLHGWPSDKDHVDECAREYWKYKEELSVEYGLLFKSDRLLVPKSIRPDVLIDLHGAHLGENNSLSLARDYVFWPLMTAHIKDKVRSCQICNAFRNQQQKETLLPHEPAGLPWEVVGTDIFQFADFYSKYFEEDLLRQPTTTCAINTMKQVFARFGIQMKVVSDNSPQYNNTRAVFSTTHEFEKLVEQWEFQHTTSSPEYPQSKGVCREGNSDCKTDLQESHSRS